MTGLVESLSRFKMFDSWHREMPVGVWADNYLKELEQYEPKGNVFLDVREPDWNAGYVAGRADMKKEILGVLRGQTEECKVSKRTTHKRDA